MSPSVPPHLAGPPTPCLDPGNLDPISDSEQGSLVTGPDDLGELLHDFNLHEPVVGAGGGGQPHPGTLDDFEARMRAVEVPLDAMFRTEEEDFLTRW